MKREVRSRLRWESVELSEHDPYRAARERLVRRQIEARGVRDPRVLHAMREVPRHRFVSDDLVRFAYEDSPLPIGEGQVITQPYLVAEMTEAALLGPDDRVLEIGTGSGYGAAVLSRVADTVCTVERHSALAGQARRRFEALGYDNILVRVGDGSLGWPEHSPYDAIIVTAGSPERVPRPLLEQLKLGGRLVIPIGPTPNDQDLYRLTRVTGDRYERENLGGVRFVPLIGARGWSEEGET